MEIVCERDWRTCGGFIKNRCSEKICECLSSWEDYEFSKVRLEKNIFYILENKA